MVIVELITLSIPLRNGILLSRFYFSLDLDYIRLFATPGLLFKPTNDNYHKLNARTCGDRIIVVPYFGFGVYQQQSGARAWAPYLLQYD
jgi:hypothetical protein